MQIHFRREGYRPGTNGESGGSVGVVSIPRAVLERHGARMLRPGEVVTLPGSRIRSTAYRWGYLLVPNDVLQNTDDVALLNRALRPSGLELVAPGPIPGAGGELERYLPYLQQIPRATEVRAREGFGQPVVVDAWTALLTLRAAAARQGGQTRAGKDDATEADAAQDDAAEADLARLRAIVSRLSIDHLLMGSALMGAGPATEGSPDTADPTRATFVRPEYGLLPVDVVIAMPHRRRREHLGSRRPVVAVLDTGVAPNPYLPVGDPPGTWYPDDFVTVDTVLQGVIRADLESKDATSATPVEVIEDEWERPVSGGRLVDDLNSHVGHGTFIAGIVRQLAPDAQVRAIRVMYGDGIVSESSLVLALTYLAARIRYAQQRAAAGQPVDPSDLVDIVNLSLGGFFETPLEEEQDSPLLDAVNALADLGVIVVAAAGNDSTTRRFYPAALAGRPPRAGSVPVVSVSALNPNGTKAAFADDGYWVNCWASGAAIVSTMPTWLRGDRTPDLHAGNRETLDIDDYSAGFGIWSGTSFAAPLVAATLAGQLLAQSTGDLTLDKTTIEARLRRADAALGKLPR
jgi:Subtilase family